MGSNPQLADTDGDGLRDPADALPADFYNGTTPVLAIASGNNQSGEPGSRLAQPLVVTVLRNGVAMANAPVTFSVTAGGLAASANAPALVGRLTVRTNAAGQALVYYTLPGVEGPAVISVQAGKATASAVATATLTPELPQLSSAGGSVSTHCTRSPKAASRACCRARRPPETSMTV